MTLAESLRAGRFAVALEITPPQKPLAHVLMRRASLLGEAAIAVNVIQRPGRQSSLDASCELREAGIAPIWHTVNRGTSRADLTADLTRAREAGVDHVLAIRGDHPAADAADGITIRQTIELTLEHLTGACIGATMNQYAPDPEAVLKNLIPKLNAGATYVQTQPVFELAGLVHLAERVRGAHPGVAVVAMAMPLVSLEDAATLQQRLGVPLPAPYLRRLDQEGEEGGWRQFEQIMAELVESPLIDGVALMTFGMDPPEGTGARIVAALERAGAVVARR